jgi:hypothetical protein
MVRPQVADGGDALQELRVAGNIVNKQSRTADKRGPIAWNWAWGLLRKFSRSLGPGQIPWINDKQKKKGNEFWYVECWKYVWGRFTQGSSRRNCKI